MKRILTLVLVISTVFVFAACSSLNNPAQPTDPTSGPTEPTATEPPAEMLTPSEDLKFKLNTGGKSYSVEGIGSCADTEIVIPSTHNDLPVTAILEDAFRDNTNIISVVIPEGITSIGSNAFLGCNLLVSVTIPNSVKVIGTYAFYECVSLAEINLPANLKSIGQQVFYGCSSLTSIAIPEGVTSIGYEAFFRCNNLTTITIPISVKSLAEKSFYECSNLKNIYYSGTPAQWEEISKGNFWDHGIVDYNVHFAKK